MNTNNFWAKLALLIVLVFSFPVVYGAVESQESEPTAQQQKDEEQDSASVILSFATDQSAKSELVAIEDETKHLVMFIMGVPLLILLLVTVGLGVAMGIYGKQVFVPHMVCAGLSLSLAMGHAVVGIVWFYPF